MDKKIVKCKLYSDYNGKIINDTLLYQANGIHITLRLTNNCNYKCTYCDLHRENEKLEPLENFKSICDTLLRADREYYEFYIHGGEPSLHPMFHEIMHYIQQTFAWRKLFILVQTNLYKPFSFYLEVPFSVKYMVSYHPMKTKFKVFKKALENLYLNQRLIGVDFMLEDTNRRKNKGDFLSLKKTKFGHIIHPRKIRSGEFSIFNHPELFPEYAKILEKYKAIDRQYLITYEDGSTSIEPESYVRELSFRSLKCKARLNKVVIDPDGSYWSCQTQMAMAEPDGNLLEDPDKFLKYCSMPMVCLWDKCRCETDLEKWR